MWLLRWVSSRTNTLNRGGTVRAATHSTFTADFSCFVSFFSPGILFCLASWLERRHTLSSRALCTTYLGTFPGDRPLDLMPEASCPDPVAPLPDLTVGLHGQHLMNSHSSGTLVAHFLGGKKYLFEEALPQSMGSQRGGRI